MHARHPQPSSKRYGSPICLGSWHHQLGTKRWLPAIIGVLVEQDEDLHGELMSRSNSEIDLVALDETTQRLRLVAALAADLAR